MQATHKVHVKLCDLKAYLHLLTRQVKPEENGLDLSIVRADIEVLVTNAHYSPPFEFHGIAMRVHWMPNIKIQFNEQWRSELHEYRILFGSVFIKYVVEKTERVHLLINQYRYYFEGAVVGTDMYCVHRVEVDIKPGAEEPWMILADEESWDKWVVDLGGTVDDAPVLRTHRYDAH